MLDISFRFFDYYDMNTTIYTFQTSLPSTYKLAVIADVHNQEVDLIIQSLHNQKPDIILIPGDFLYGYYPANGSKIEESPNTLTLLKECIKLAPIFASLGNHEWCLTDADIQLLKDLGIILLDNEYVHFKDFCIGGLTSHRVLSFRKKGRIAPTSRFDTVFKKKKKHYPDISWLKDFEEEDGYKILLSHHPEDWDYIKDYEIQYILSGHAHGGQFRFFDIFHRKWRGVFAPSQGWFPKYSEGIFKGEHGYMIVSRGLANTVEPIPRLFNPKQMIYLVLQKQ